MFKSANVCVSESWYARQPVYSATLRRWVFVFFFPPLFFFCPPFFGKLRIQLKL